jgi:hypothetical protein
MLAFTELKNVLKSSTEKKGNKTENTAEGLKEQKRKRRSSTEGDRPESTKKQGAGVQQEIKRTTASQATITLTRNFFASLRELEMDDAAEVNGEEVGPGNTREWEGEASSHYHHCPTKPTLVPRGDQSYHKR